MSMIIPAETVDHILGFLQDYTTLKTCSVVFPLLVDRHLYSQIAFFIPLWRGMIADGGCYVVDPTELSLLLIERPHIANYVRVVRILLRQNIAEDSYSAIGSVLSNLCQLESIAIIALMSGTTLDQEFFTAIRNTIHFPSIKKVTIKNVDVPLRTFEHCKNLTRLQLISRCGDAQGLSTTSYPRLSSLYVSRYSDWTRIASWMTSNTLHTLTLRIHCPGDLHKFRTLLEACSASLVDLVLDNSDCIDWDSDFVGTPPAIPERQLSFLKLGSIKIVSQVIMRCDESHSCLSSIISSLGSLLATSNLSPIQMILYCRVELCTPPPFTNLDWIPLANVLVLPIFQYPITLGIRQSGGGSFSDIVSSFEQNSDIKIMLGDGRLKIIGGGKDEE